MGTAIFLLPGPFIQKTIIMKPFYLLKLSQLLPAVIMILASGAPIKALATDCNAFACFGDDPQGLRVDIGGRLQFDGAVYDNDNGTGFADGTNVRRARMSIDAFWGQYWSFDFTYDFSKDALEGIRDAFVRYTGVRDLRLTAGHFKAPFGLERLTSVRDLPFMERSMSSVFTPSRNLGFEVHKHRPDRTIAAAVYETGLGDDDTGGGFGTAARTTWAPWHSAGQILHIGTGVAHRFTETDQPVVFAKSPETEVDNLKLVDTGILQANGYTQWNLEFAGAYGPLFWQAEYIQTRLYRAANGQDLEFDGWYISGGWFISGEHTDYNHEKGTFGRIKPGSNVFNGGRGAWQLGARLSGLDLNDADVRGGNQKNLTLGLSWYLSPKVRLNTEYIKVLSIQGGAFANAEPALFQTRLQIIF